MQTKKIKRAQTFLEYVLLISVVTAIMIAMSTMLRRSVQGMVKVVADQVGIQNQADQEDGKRGYLKKMEVKAKRDKVVRTRDRLGNISYIYETDYSEAQVFVLTNAGFTED